MVKADALSFRIDAPVKAALERAAAADDRSVSSMVDRILRAWLIEKGFLEITDKAPSSTPSSD
jgi:hypothetical protein